MKFFGALLIIAVTVTSCATLRGQVTLSQAKEGLECIQYKDDLEWSHVADRLGSPDITPLPKEGNDLSKNTRIYKKTIVIFYVERKKFEKNGKLRFREVVNNIELCD